MSSNLKSYRNKKVLVTGGLGFIGSNLAMRLTQLGAQVTLVDSMIPNYGGNPFNIHSFRDKIEVNYSDVRNESSINFLVQGKDYLFNLAGQISHIDSMVDPYTDLDINVRSQLSILEVCRKYNPNIRIIHTSTRQFYGKPQYLPVDEKHPLNPVDINGINKLAGEWYHLLYNRVHSLQTVIIRLTNTYGPRQLVKHNRQGFIPWFIRQIVLGEEIKIFGDGKQIRDINYVDDVVLALLIAGISPRAYGQIFNLGGETISLIDLVNLMISVNGEGNYRLVPFPPDKKKIDIGNFYADYRKISEHLGWKPRVKLRKGIEKTINYYKRFGEHYWE